jgi:hypothetical protein
MCYTASRGTVLAVKAVLHVHRDGAFEFAWGMHAHRLCGMNLCCHACVCPAGISGRWTLAMSCLWVSQHPQTKGQQSQLAAVAQPPLAWLS